MKGHFERTFVKAHYIVNKQLKSHVLGKFHLLHSFPLGEERTGARKDELVLRTGKDEDEPALENWKQTGQEQAELVLET